YNVSDTLTVVGGTSTTPAQLLVTNVDASGAITGVAILQPGQYSIQPTNPVSVTGGAGTGATFTLFFNSGNITDAATNTAPPPNNLASPSNFQINVNITDPKFTTLNDLDVTVNLRHPNLQQ